MVRDAIDRYAWIANSILLTWLLLQSLHHSVSCFGYRSQRLAYRMVGVCALNNNPC